jgi:hypothetical protein
MSAAIKKLDLFFYQWLLVIALFAMACTGCGTSKLVSKTTEISRDTSIRSSKDSSSLVQKTEVKEHYVQPASASAEGTIKISDIPDLQKVITIDRPVIIEDSTSQIKAKYWFDAYNNLRFQFTSKPAPVKVVDSATTTNALRAINNDSKDVKIQYKDKIVKDTEYRLSLKAMLWTMGLTAIGVFILMITPIGRMIKGLFSGLAALFTKKSA